MFVGEPKDINELLLRLKADHIAKFKPRSYQPLKDPFNVMSRIGISRVDAELIIKDLKMAECIDMNGLACDDDDIPCKKMWPFKHVYAPRNGDGPFDLFIKLGSMTKIDPRNNEKELVIVYVISFHEDD